ncbi:hypothetical protein V6N11_027575 [Hibiscus sabdariffa]|uniref:Uncharacterized protein n=1 Tax=Hibiscus sabdariffa TaxID=183260 RepID=A0ABR1ZMK0_9ROSI
MKKKRCRRQRILILSLLSFSLFAPMVLLSQKLKTLNSIGQDEFNEELASVKYRTDDFRLNAIEQKASPELKGRKIIVLNEKDLSSIVSHSSDENHDSNQSSDAQHASKLSGTNASEINDKGEDRLQIQQKKLPRRPRKQEQFNREAGRHQQSRIQSHRGKSKRFEQAVHKASKDSDLPRSASHIMRSMEVWLEKMNHALADCFEMAKILRVMANETEELIQAEKNQESYLVQVAGRTTPKGLHCLSMRLTDEYFFTST